MLKSASYRTTEVGELLLERDGSVITDQARRPCRWEEHFRELLSLSAPPNTKGPGHRRDQKIVPHSLASNPVLVAVRNIVAHKRQGLPGSGMFKL